MMKNPAISVIVPVYGVEKYIEKCARSLFNQDYENVEFIFVDDGSEDRSVEILNDLIDREFSHLKEKIRIIHQENSGLPAARRNGLRHATGDYILHVDSDDRLVDGALSRIAAAAVETDADMIYFDFIREFREKIRPKKTRNYRTGQKDKLAMDLIDDVAFGYLWNKCFKRSIYTSNEVYFAPCSMNEDTYLVLQLVHYVKSIYHLKEYLYIYNRHNKVSISRVCSRNDDGRHPFCINMLDLYRRFGPDIEGTPMEKIIYALMLRVAYYTWKFNFEFFSTHREIAEYVQKAPLRTGGYVSLYRQLYLKRYLKNNY